MAASANHLATPVFDYNPGRLGNDYIGGPPPGVTFPLTAAATLDNTYTNVPVNATGGAVTITIPTAATYTENKAYRVYKTDSSTNVVTVQFNAADTVTGYLPTAAGGIKVLINQGDDLFILSDGVSNWEVLGIDPEQDRLISRTSVILTATGQTTLFTVPTGKTLKDARIRLEGQVAMSGGTSSTLKVGTTANSYVELLNNSTGAVFASGTATSLLAVGQGGWAANLYPPATVSVSDTTSFAAGTVIQASVSGTVLTAGKVFVELFGRLI